MKRTTTFSAGREAWKRLPEESRAGEHPTSEPERWPMKDSIPPSYLYSFESFMEGATSLEGFIGRRREQGLGNVVLDLASDGGLFTQLRDERHDGALAIGISDPRTNEATSQRYAERDVDVIAGNVLANATWTKMDRWTQSRGKNGFDLIFFRPGNGIFYIGMRNDNPHLSKNNSHEGVLATLLARAYGRLNTDGQLFAEIDPDPTPDHVASYQEYARRLGMIPGITAEVAVSDIRTHLVFHLRKSNGAPDELPKDLWKSRPTKPSP